MNRQVFQPPTSYITTSRRAALLLLTGALASCGGGGGSPSSNTTSSTTTAAAPNTAVTDASGKVVAVDLPAGYTQTKFWDFRGAKALPPEWRAFNRELIGSDLMGGDMLGFSAAGLTLNSEIYGAKQTSRFSPSAQVYSRCGGIETQGAWTQASGWFEASIKVAAASGARSAFWMMPYDPGTDAWWQRGEIDIVEVFGNPSGAGGKNYQAEVVSTVHSGPPQAQQQVRKTVAGKVGDGIHRFATAWDNGKFEFFLDGVSTGAFVATGPASQFSKPFFPMLTLTVSEDLADLDGAITQATRASPPSVLIEWVRAGKK